MGLNSLQWIFFIYSCISMTLYSFLIFSIFKERRSIPILRGSFFRLVIAHFIADLVLCLEFNILMRARKYGYLNSLFPDDGNALYIVPRISNALHYYIKIVVYIGQVYFALNRLTSAMFPLDYNGMWTRKRLRFLALIQWTIPLAAVLPVHLNMEYEIKYIKIDEADTLRLVTDTESTSIIAYIDMGCSVTCTILSLCMYIGTMLIVRSGMQGRQPTGTTRLAAIELRLLLSAFIVFVVLTFNSLIQVLTVIANNVGLKEVLFINDLSYPMVDLIYTCQPWALLIFSSVMRKSLLNTARRHNHKPVPLSNPTEKDDCRDTEPSA